MLAWEDIDDDEDTKARLDTAQRRVLDQKVGRARGDLKESIFRAYRHLYLLGKDNTVRHIDLGVITSSMGASLVEVYLNQLIRDDEITEGVGPNQLAKYWPATVEWSVKAARDAFYSSPLLPRLLRPEAIKRTVADGVSQGIFGYLRKDASGNFRLERYAETFSEQEVEISEDVFIVKR